MSAYQRPAILDAILQGRRHAFIEASAGTGKTYTIENLVVELVVTGQARLEEILIVTFTEKATQELLKKVRRRLEEILQGTNADASGAPVEGHTPVALTPAMREHLTRAVFGFDAAQIFTIHGFCNRVLADNAFHNGQLFESAIVEKREIFDRAFRRVLRRRFAKEPLLKAFLTAYLGEKSARDLNQLLFAAHGKRHAEFHPVFSEASRAAAAARFAETGRLEPVIEALAEEGLPFASALVQLFLPVVSAEVEALKRRDGALDYDDMLDRLHDRVTGPAADDLLHHLRAQYRFALIDEFQDTDLVQWAIFKAIFAAEGAPHRLFLIGDPKQAIYGFRGADVHAYLQARRELAAAATEVTLEKNFRSTGDVIDAYNHLFHTRRPAFFAGEITYPAPVGCGRPALTLQCGEDSAPVHLVDASGGADDLAERFARILQRLLVDPAARLHLRDGAAAKPVAAHDIFVLTRTGREQQTVAAALRKAGVPYTFYKQAGLFTSPEAGDVIALLRAVDEPHRRALRLRAWATPFFGVPWVGLRACLDLPGSHPLLRSLERWHELARARKFGALFEAVLDESKVLERLLLMHDGEREVANYLHLFELLTGWAARTRSTLGDLVRRLVQMQTRKPTGEDEGGDLFRTESESPAVQIMTIHKSKGLEADVVFLFGGLKRSNLRSEIGEFHRAADRRRMLCVGTPDADAAARMEAESKEEEARLYYVALTRARARLYLPYVSDLDKHDGPYRPVLERLAAAVAERDADPKLARWFVTAEDRALTPAPAGPAVDAAPFLGEPPAHGAALERLKTGDLAPIGLESYSGLKRRLAKGPAPESGDDREAMDDAGGDELHPADELRPGRITGVFLHEALELVDPAPLAAGEGAAAWRARPEIAALFDDLLERYEIPARNRAHAEALVHTAMTAPLALDGIVLPGLCRAEKLTRELEFLYPIPEDGERRFDLDAYDGFTVKRGYVRGFIDVVFQAGGKVYFADWKSDALDDFTPGALAAHVQNEYLLQTRLYTLGLVRMLRATRATYEARFGGLVYVFLRGLTEKADGRHAVYHARPSWDELQRYAAAVAQGRWVE